MAKTAQTRAIERYRKRLSARGMARFEIVGLAEDGKLLRALAQRLARGDRDAERVRATVSDAISGERATKGGVLVALRRSPLVGAGLELKRARVSGRKIDL
jgi:hypothetical protein